MGLRRNDLNELITHMADFMATHDDQDDGFMFSRAGID